MTSKLGFYLILFALPVFCGSAIAGPYNIAPLAKVTASPGGDPNAVVDGIISIDGIGEWNTQSEVRTWGGTARPWIQLTWDTPQNINRVIIYDRPAYESHFAAGILSFDDGSRIFVSEIPNDGKAKVVDFQSKKTKWIKFQATDTNGPNIGLSEIEVFPAPEDYVDYVSKVDPFIETEKCRYFYFASGSLPFGMISAAPLTRNKNQNGGGYNYNSLEIFGFPQLHCWQLAGFNLMPTAGKIDPRAGEHGWKSKFSHDGELAQPGYHRVFLDDYRIWIEQTCTDRVSFYKFRYTEDVEANILLHLGGYLASITMTDAQVTKISNTEIEGSINTMGRQWGGPDHARKFFVMRFDTPFESLNAWNSNEILKDIDQFQGSKDAWYKDSTRRSHYNAPCAGVNAVYQVKKGDEIQVKIAISYTSIDNARNNMDTECDHWDFDKVLADARTEWNKWLGRIDVQGGTGEQQIKFYTDLWHVLLGRHKLDDASGDYPDYTQGERQGSVTVNAKLNITTLPKDANGKVKFHMYNSDAFWLTQWNLNLLWGLAWPEVLDDFAACLVQYAENGGLLPRGPHLGTYSFIMTGCPATNLITCAYQKGMLTKTSHEKAYKAMVENHKPGGMMGYLRPNKDLQFYINNGYYPGNASISLEIAFQDWALSQMAAKMGKTKDAAYYLKRSQGWEKLFHHDLKLLMPKDETGKWTNEDPLFGTGWVETNSWQATWSVSHAIPRLAELMGGFDVMCDMLNYAFEQSVEDDFGYGVTNWRKYVNYANQPGCSNAHVFNYAGKPWLSQYWARRVYDQLFSHITTSRGYGGRDEDQGQLGGVSALLAMGLFNIKGTCEQKPAYEISSPIFDKITIHLNPRYYSGEKFVIKTFNNSMENCYIQRAMLNGQPHRSFLLEHEVFAKGGLLELWLDNEPNKEVFVVNH